MIAPVVDGSPAGSRLGPAFASIRDRTIDVLSVGAFDALLLTRVPDVADAHELLGRRLVDEGLLAPMVNAQMFAAMRARAEEIARRDRRQRGESSAVTLAEIHAQLPDLALAGDRTAVLDIEQAILGDLSFVDPAVHELLRVADAAGISVVVTADSKLSEPELRNLLGRCGVTVALRAVFSSASRRVGATSGLFRVVVDELAVSPDRVLHIGAAAEADAARAAGLHALSASRPDGLVDHVVALERAFDEQQGNVDTNPLDPVVGDAGVTAARRRFSEQPPPATVPPQGVAYWSAGGIVVGPVLAGFAAWVVDRARERGWRRVHCLPREHTLLAPLLEGCTRDDGAPVEVGELALSELLCAQAAITECDYGELRVFLTGPVLPTVRQLCTALGLDPTDLGDLAGYPEGRLDDPSLREVALGRITGDERVRQRVLSMSSALRERLRALVERSVLDETLAVVDLGPKSVPERAIARALRAAGSDVQVAGCSLLTTDDTVDAVFDGVEVEGYLTAGGNPAQFLRLVDGASEMLDRLCAADEPEPVDVVAMRRGIVEFQSLHRSMVPSATTELAAACAPLLRRILQRFACAPIEHEVDMFGDWWPDDRTVTAHVSAPLECTLDADTGAGFTGASAIRHRVPLSETNMSPLRLTVAGDGIVRVQLVPVPFPAVVRIDRLEVRLSVRGKADPTVLTFASHDELLEWQLSDCSWLADNVLGVPTRSPQMVLVIDNALYGSVYEVTVAASMAVLELPQAAVGSDERLVFGTTRAPVLGQGLIDLWVMASDLGTPAVRRLKRRPRQRG